MISDKYVNEPGTLVWVGNRAHPEFVDAFRFCREHAAQLAIRHSPRELVKRPAGMVKRILFSRLDRRPLQLPIQSALAERYAGAQWLALNSTLCDGEARTGAPWPNVRHVRFSRWQEVLPNWIEPCGYRSQAEQLCGSILLLCDRYELAEPYLEFAAVRGQTAWWQRSLNSVSTRNIRHVIWDDSIATAATPEVWRQRVSHASNARHIWLATQPRISEINAAMAGRFSRVLTKPVVAWNLFHD